MALQAVAGWQRFRIGDIKAGPQPALVQFGQKRILIDQPAAADIDDVRRGLHARQPFGVQQMLGGRRDRGGQHEMIGAGHHLVQRCGAYIRIGRRRGTGAGGNDLHAKGMRIFPHLPRDIAQADQAQRAPVQGG